MRKKYLGRVRGFNPFSLWRGRRGCAMRQGGAGDGLSGFQADKTTRTCWPMSALRILHLSDGRPGHYHLAEGVIAALGRLRAVEVSTVPVRRRWLVPGRLLRFLIEGRRVSPRSVLALGYGIDLSASGNADLVVSSGGETLAANMAAARTLGAQNIFVGSLRGLAPANFSLIVSSYARHAELPRHLVTMKPSAVDPDALGRPRQVPRYGPDNPPKLAGLLLGGNSGLFKYKDAEWRRLLDFAAEVSRAWGTRWLVSTSRRTAPATAEAAFNLAKDKGVVADFIDYKLSGPGSLARIFGKADVIVCTEDFLDHDFRGCLGAATGGRRLSRPSRLQAGGARVPAVAR